MSEELPTLVRPTFGQAFRYWLRLGFVNFGGPAGQIALMHRDLVERRRWISDDRFLHALNFCMMLPGPEAQQLAIYIGWRLHRTVGGVVAGVLFVLPSVVVLLGLSFLYAVYGTLPAVTGALWGIKPIVVAIVLDAILRIGKRALRHRGHLVIAVAAFLAIAVLNVPFPFIVLAAALAGLAGARWAPQALRGSLQGSPRDNVADPETDGSSGKGRLFMVLSSAVLLWLIPYLLLVLSLGPSSLHVKEYLFFTQAALVTFGGAYAVLAYVTQKVVEDFGWLSATQAVDGLALAETTPGPLIMVLQFVGFMAAWNHPEALPVVAGAVLGALVTTYATFLPSFLFILAGAPYVEKLRQQAGLSAALAGVTAAVVGVILNLGVVFGSAVLVPGPLTIDLPAAGVVGIGFIVLHRYKVDAAWVVLGGATLGLLRALVA